MSIKQSIIGNNNSQTNIGTLIQVGKMSSLLEDILPKLAAMLGKDAIPLENDTVAFDITDKIAWNNLKLHQEFLDDYGEYGRQIDEMYDEYEASSPGFKKRIYNFFKNSYRMQVVELSKGVSKAKMEIIRDNADSIFKHVADNLSQNIRDSKDISIKIEEVATCSVALTCHAFINCKILEKPEQSK